MESGQKNKYLPKFCLIPSRRARRVARAQKCKLILSPSPTLPPCLGFPLFPWVNAGAAMAAPSTWTVVCVASKLVGCLWWGLLVPRRR